MPLGTRDILLMIRARDQASRVFHEVGRSMGVIGAQGRMTGSELMGVGTMLQGIGIAIGAIGVGSIAFLASATKAAMAYRQEAALTLTQVDGFKASIEDIENIGKRVARAIPAPFEQMQKSLYDIFSSMNVSLPGAERLLKNFAMAAVAGSTDVQTAGRATIAIMNAFKIPVSEVGRVMDLQFQTVRKGVITYDEFAKTIGRAIPSTVKAGQSVETLSGMIAFLTRNGLSAAMASTSAARAMDLLANPKFAARMQEFGIAVHDAEGNIRPMTDVMGELRDKLQKLPIEDRAAVLAQLSAGAGGVIQAMRFVNLAVSDTNDLLPQMVGHMNNASGAMRAGYDIMKDTPQNQIQALKNSWADLRQEIGERFFGAVGKIAAHLQQAIEWFKGLSKETQDNIIKFIAIGGAVTAAVGALTVLFGLGLQIIGVWRIMGPLIANLGGSFIGLAGALTTASGAATALRAGLNRLLVFGAIAAGIQSVKWSVDQLNKGSKEGASFAKGMIDSWRDLPSVATQIYKVEQAIRQQKAAIAEGRKEMEDAWTGSSKWWAAHDKIEGANKAIDTYKGRLKELKAEEKDRAKETSEAYKELQSSAGELQAAQVRLSGATAEEMKEMAKAAQEMRESIGEAFKSATSVVSALGSETEVTKAKVLEFFKKTVEDARNWATNLTALAKAGLDQGLLEELRLAGPKAAPLVAALLDAVKTGNLATINKAQEDLRTILTGVQDQVKSSGTFLQEAGKVAGSATAAGIKQGVDEGVPVIELGAKQASERGVFGWRAKMEDWKKGGKEVAEAAKKGIDETIPVIELGGQQASGRGSWGWRSKFHDWKSAGREAAEEAGKAIDAAAGVPEAAAGRAGSKAVQAVRAHKPDIHAAGKELTSKLAEGIEIHDREVYDELREMVRSGAQVIREEIRHMRDAGGDLMEGVAAGIRGRYGPVHSALVAMANRMKADFRREMQAASPSKVFADLAHSIPEGVASGIAQREKVAYDAANRMWDNLARGGLMTQPMAIIPAPSAAGASSTGAVGSQGDPTGGRGDVHLHFNGYQFTPEEAVDAVTFSRLTDGW